MSQGRIAERVALMPRCTAMSKRTRRRCGHHASPGYPVCYHHGAHRNGGPIDNVNRLVHGNWIREELAARKAASAVGRAARAAVRNVEARFKGTVSAEQGALDGILLQAEMSYQLETQKIAREEKARRLKRKRARRGRVTRSDAER